MVCLLTTSCALLADVWQELSPSKPCMHYQPMTEAQLQLAESLFLQLLQVTDSSEEPSLAGWKELGYAGFEIPGMTSDWIALRETTSPCRGNGIFLVNRRNPGHLVVQAPHAYHDLFTGTITGGLMNENIAILAWSTAKRRFQQNGRIIQADLAKRWDSLFMALTRAQIRNHPEARLIQIHGFDSSKRTTAAGASAAIILSSGSRWITQSVTSIAQCLRPLIDGPILVYPRDISELGATTNVSAQTFQRHGHEGFIHIELNKNVRQRLHSDPVLLRSFASCLGTGTKP